MKVQQSYAPFGSVSVKTKRQKPKIADPGPGSYDISLPIIVPIVQTIRKKNNNVIVKLGHLGTASFQNDVDRFKLEHLPAVGPGQCRHNIMQILPKRHLRLETRSKARRGAWQGKRYVSLSKIGQIVARRSLK